MTEQRKRCSSTYRKGEVVHRCEDIEGHTSAHYDGKMWWHNPVGYPKISREEDHAGRWLLVGVIAFLVFVLLMGWWLARSLS